MELGEDTSASLSGQLGETVSGQTPLHMASISNSGEIARLLIDNGEEISRRDDRGWTPLYVAATCGSNDVLQILIQKTKDPEFASVLNTPDTIGLDTPLRVALRRCDSVCALALIKAEVDLNARTQSERTPPHYALIHCPDQAAAVLTRELIGHADRNGCTALHWACFLGALDLIVEVGRNLNQEDFNMADSDGSTPIHFLAQSENEHVDSAKYLLSRGTQPHVQNEAGFTPLHYAVRHGHFQLAGYLIGLGYDPTAVTADGNTALLEAAVRDDCPDNLWARLATASLPPYGDEGIWPLHQAALRLNADEIRGLIRRGVSVSAVNARGESALYLAACRYTTHKAHLRDVEAQCNPVSLLLHQGSSPTQRSAAGLSPLHVALIRGNIPLLRDILGFVKLEGPESLHRFPCGVSMLQHAVMHSNVACLDWLLQCYEEKGLRSHEGNPETHPFWLAMGLVFRLLVGDGAKSADGLPDLVSSTPNYRELLANANASEPVSVPDKVVKCGSYRLHAGPSNQLEGVCKKALCLLIHQVQTTQQPIEVQLHRL